MVMADPIADLLIRIKNGYRARKKSVFVSYSKIKEKICQLLKENGYLEKYEISSENQKKKKFKFLELTLKYEGKKPALTEVRRISKPGLRIYKKANEIPRVEEGFGITVVSTNKGLLTDKQAKAKKLGGEVLFQVW